MTIKANEIKETSPWQEMTIGGEIYEGGTSVLVNTGDWRTLTPGWIQENCRHCLLCFAYCPDSSIPVTEGKRQEFDFMHCKGCGICFKVCPFHAISFQKEDK